MEINEIKQRLEELKKQEKDFDSEEAKIFPNTLKNFRIVAERERLSILSSNRKEQRLLNNLLDEEVF